MHLRERGERHAAAIPLIAAALLFIFGLYPLANRLTEGEAVQWYRHARTFWMLFGGSLVVVLLALGRWQHARMTRLASMAGTRIVAISPALFAIGIALIAFAAAAVLAVVCFGRQPHNADEVAQLFHAKILLSGRLSLPVDANPEFFGMDNMIEHGRWYSQFPVGGPAFLAIATALSAAWLLNPVLIGLTTVSVYLFTRRAYDESSARLAAILFAASPFALFMGASFMNHVPTLWLASVAMWQLAVWNDAADARALNRSAALIGVSLGVAFTVRPLDALAIGGVIGLFQLRLLMSNSRRARSILFEIVGGLIPVAILFFVNAQTNGSPARLGYEVLYGSAHQLGFHADPYGTMHTPVRALIYASKYLLQLNVLLFEWPLPAVGIIIAGLVALQQPTRWDVFLIGVLLAEVGAYAFYWHDGGFRGPRFLFTALAAIVILTARAPFNLAARSSGAFRVAVVYAIPACIVCAWCAYGLGDSALGRIKQYRRASPIGRVDADSLERVHQLKNAVVFVNEGREARNLHYLWALGLSRGDAARLMVSAPSCAVRIAIDEEEAMRPARTDGRRNRLIRRAMTIDPAAPEPEVCKQDVRRDDAGSAAYAVFFAANDIDSKGAIGGDVVYALDLGEHNEALRSRFGDRTWYRFGPLARPTDVLPTLIPYTR